MTQFSDFGLSAPILKALAAEGYSEPTPIQAQAIAPALAGRDLVGLAQTGTGKTAAFALPILQRLSDARRHPGAKGVRCLVLAPTRELAAQIGDSFRVYGKFLGLSTAVVFGGASMYKQTQALQRGVDILVATPGRLLDHVAQRTCRLDGVEILVLDEADHMMDLGFIVPLKRIVAMTPAQRQTLFFSATMPDAIADLAKAFLNEPVRVAVTPVASTAERVDQVVIHVDGMKKQDLLESLLRDSAITRAVVFTRTKHGADRVVRNLEEAGIPAEALHGNKSQGQRERALDAFKKGRARLLVATEIAARGIDIDQVSHVINYDLPDVPEQYVHRIGRTARAGCGGSAISFCAPDERICLRDIEKLIQQAVPVMEHALSIPAQKAGERLPPKAPRGRQQQPRGRKPQGGPKAEGRPPQRREHAERREPSERREHGERPHAERQHADRQHGDRREHNDRRGDHGERRDRKGNAMWSNDGRGQNNNRGGNRGNERGDNRANSRNNTKKPARRR